MNAADAAVAALVVLCVIAAASGARVGSPRNAINMLFEWIGMGLVYFLVRWLVKSGRETRALVATMVALAMVMAAYGFFQVFVGLPSTREAYAANPEEAMRELGQWLPPDSPVRKQFEDRLASSEPLATFALTNSLAGFLAPWLIVALAIGLGLLVGRLGSGASAGDRATVSRTLWAASLGGAAACVVAVAACLVLTKSRSAYLAAAAGVALLPVFDSALRRRFIGKRVLVAGGAVLLMIIIGGVATGKLDVQVLSEARKSVDYRLEYWQATLAMIADHPWLGVGPGNFQDYYTQYKLPQASEEIRDPHNFLFEVWATAGTAALVALIAALGALAWRTWRINSPQVETARQQAAALPETESTRGALWMAAGAAGGFLLAFLIGPSIGMVLTEQQLLGGLLVGGVTLALLWPWVLDGAMSPRLPALAMLVLAIHLLAAGGIGYPGVAGTFWTLAAMAINESDAPPRTDVERGPRRSFAWAPAIGCAVACAAAVACYVLAYRPVLASYATMTRAAELHQSSDERIELLLEAAAADPYSAEPWAAIAEIELSRLRRAPGEGQAIAPFETAASKLLELRPHSSAAWRQVGRWYGELAVHDHRPQVAQQSATCLRRATELYPNSAELRGEYALALLKIGDTQAAREQAQRARELDAQTPHADKKLSKELRQGIERINSAPR